MRSFRRLAISTLTAVYVLILVGGIVRSTGAGMGCPDWPKCFGQWVPPTSVEQLPENYKEEYAAFRAKKNVRFATYLSWLGFKDEAYHLVHDPMIKVESDFNPTKTWIEYVNRLTGVVIGFLIFALAVRSFGFRKTDSVLTTMAVGSFLLVVFQGWIGSIVVSSNLTPWIITLHMFLAILLVAMLIYVIHRSSFSTEISSHKGYWWAIACMLVTLIQILLGTQLREAIDVVALTLERSQWVEGTGMQFILHRSFSWLLVIVHTGLVVTLWKTEGAKIFLLSLIVLLLCTVVTGSGMAFFAIPPYLQPLHLLFATLTFGAQYMFFLKIDRKDFNVAVGS